MLNLRSPDLQTVAVFPIFLIEDYFSYKEV